MNEIRAEYEKEFPVPPQTMWSEQYGGYINCAACPNFAAAVHQERWLGWRQAHARYAGRCQYIATGDGGTSYCRLAAQPKVPGGFRFTQIDGGVTVEVPDGGYVTVRRNQSGNTCAHEVLHDLVKAMLSAQENSTPIP